MSTKQCAKCNKTVYTTEELKCLDKVWHKTCFKCWECGMTLNMRNYKGFDRKPYCNAHCPQAKYTTVAETPEIRRIQENTKIQSTVRYHEEFEKQKGKVTQIADDPETLRVKQTTKIISNVAYHGDLEKKAAMEQRRPLGEDGEGLEGGDEGNVVPYTNNVHPPAVVAATNHAYANNAAAVDNRAAAYNHNAAAAANSHQPAHAKGIPTHNMSSSVSAGGVTRVVAESEPPTANKETPYTSRQTSTVIYTSEHGPGTGVANNMTTPPSRKVGSIVDYDPINDQYGSTVPQQYHMAGQPYQQQMNAQQYRSAPEYSHQVMQQQPVHPGPVKSTGRKFRALYDYTAADTDEVSFLDGDFIVNCVPVDEGWMTGTVMRTGQSGMLPANYVEPVN